MSDSDEINWYSNEAATFGDRVAAARDARQMTQKQLAKRLGVGLKTVEGWENDVSEPRANKLQTLSGVLNVSIPWLLTGEGLGVELANEDPSPPEIAEVLAEMRVLRTDLQRSAERLGVLEKRLKGVLSKSTEAAE
jgi:transcriptional regulator with XRE-family HTH domain